MLPESHMTWSTEIKQKSVYLIGPKVQGATTSSWEFGLETGCGEELTTMKQSSRHSTEAAVLYSHGEFGYHWEEGL